jgi:hypothetical protein
VVGGGVPGWMGLGVLFALAGLAYSAIVLWGLRTRQPSLIARHCRLTPSLIELPR